MDRSRATFEAYDGVEFRVGEGTVKVPSLSVGEAVRFLRLLARVEQGDGAANHEAAAMFSVRSGVEAVVLSDLGWEGPGGSLTVGAGIAFARQVDIAQTPDGWSAQAHVLDRAPRILGVDGEPAEVFGAARAFAQQVYTLVYGLARDFWIRPHLSLKVRAMTAPRPRWSSTRGSTT